MKNKKVVSHCIGDLKKAFQYNIEAHQYRDFINENWQDQDVSYEVGYRDRAYYLKQKHIKKAILKIKKFKLPIKYGTNEGVTYFEYLGKQISFHTFSQMDNVGGKKFKGKWSGKINTEFPF